MSNVYYTSDIHIGHTTIAKLRAEQFYPELFNARTDDNEFDEWEQDVTNWHDEWLANRWDSVLKPGDVVWLLGDISSGTKTAQLGALDWVNDRIAATGAEVHLITGNHDDAHPMHRDSYKWQPIYLQTFKTVQAFGRRRIPYDHEGHADAHLSHFPYHGDHGKERYIQYRLPDLGRDFIIHGHTHSSKRFRARQIHVGVDAWAGELVPNETILAYVNGRYRYPETGRPARPSDSAPAETSWDGIVPGNASASVGGLVRGL